MVEPIKPDQVKANKLASIPDEVIEAFNELIAKNFSDGFARVEQSDVIRLAILKGLNRTLFDHRWLDVEDLYRAQGWHVYYDKPGYNESGEAAFTFGVAPRERTVRR